MNDFFTRVARRAATILGSAGAFVVATVVVLIWAASGPFFHYSDTWQLVINTGTTVVTFLMVFIVQNSQDRVSKAAQLKLDELIRAQEGARNRLIRLEGLDDAEMAALEAEFLRIREKAPLSPQPVETNIGIPT
jgi:low affinity Fe/Cu permease